MKKIYSYLVGAMVLALPVSLVAVAGLPSINAVADEATTTAEATINFQDSAYAVSTGTSTDGDITEPSVFQIGEGTLTVNPNNGGTANRFWAASGKPQLRVYGGSLKFEAPAGRAITKITFVQKKWGTVTYEPASETTKAGEWTGNATSVTMTVSTQCQINSITVTYDDANSETATPGVKVITFNNVDDIATFNTLPKDSAVRLTLTDAYVTKVTATNIYVQDGTAAVLFYNTGLNLEEGQVLNGTIIGKASPYNGTPEFVANDSTNLDKVTITEGTLTPKDVTVADVTTDVLSQLVKLGEAQLIDSAGAHYAVQGTDTIQVYDQFKVLGTDYAWPEVAQSITAIVGSYKGKVQLLPVSADAIEEKPAPALEAGDYYLYNVGTKKWLCAGNSWGTQASLDDYGLDFTVAALEDGTYTLDSRVANNATDHFLGSNAFVDAKAYGWTATNVSTADDAEKVITLSTADGKYLAFSGNGTVVSTTTDGTADNAKWIAVSKAQRLSDIKAALATASKENPVDVTLFFQGMNFGRNDQRNSAWQGSPSINGNNTNNCAEKYNTTFDVYQTAEVPNGMYTVIYQGFYRDGNSANAATAHAAGTEKLNATAYAGNVSKPVQSIFNGADKNGSVGNNTALGYVPQTMSDASQYFTAGLYSDTLADVSVTTGSLKIGIKQETAGTDANWTIFDNFRVLCTSNQIDLTIYKEAYDAALAAAKEAQKDTVVTGEELTALNATVAQYETIAEPSQEAYVEATEALTQATEALVGARPSYSALANAKAAVKEYPYAAEKKVADLNATLAIVPASAAEADSLTTALQQQERLVSESNVKAEADTTATNMTDSIINPTAADDLDANVWKTTGGKMNIKSNEPWTDADGNAEHRYFDSENWSTTAWTTSLTQNVKLEEGKYILSVISRGSADLTEFKLFAKAGDTELGSLEMPHAGASNGLFNRGWDRSYIVFEVPADTTVTLGVEGATSTVHNWMSFSDFRLVQFTAAPHLTGSFEADDNSDLEPNVGRPFYITLINKGKRDIESHHITVGYINTTDESASNENYFDWTCPAIAAGDTLTGDAYRFTMKFTKTGTYYMFLADQLTGDTIRSNTFNVVEIEADRDTAITLAPTDSIWYAYVGQEKSIDVTFAHTGTSGTIQSFYVYLGYENADDESQYGDLDPYYAYSGTLAPNDSNVVTVTWTPTAEGTYYLYYETAAEETFYTDKTIKVFATKEEMDGVIAGIGGVKADAKASADVYTVNGQLVRKDAKTLMGLPKGIYIQGGKKIVVK